MVDDRRRAPGVAVADVLAQPPRRQELVPLLELAAQFCRVPAVTVNLLNETEEHIIAAVGSEVGVFPGFDSLSAAVLTDDRPVAAVPDTCADPRVAANPWVTGELGNVRFFACHELVSPIGGRLGTLCISDTVPRVVDPAPLAVLATLSDRVVGVFELAVRTRELFASLNQVESLRADLERSNDRLAAFAGQVTHDLKTPLTTMSLSLELIRDELEDGASAEDVLPLISRALGGSERMTTMIEDVLAFARLGTSIDPTPVDLAKVVAEVVADLASDLDDVKLIIDELPTVPGDEAQLRSLLQNLLSNAVKFRSPDRPPAVTVTSSRVGSRWRIEVIDNGIGIPAEQRYRVFEPLVRLDKRINGVGIGLATCRRVVDSHGGVISVTTPESGEGAAFWVELPSGRSESS